MKIILLQTDICWASPSVNVNAIDAVIDTYNKDVDLFVLPEMFSTGFCTNPEGTAESAEGESLQWMKQKAMKRNRRWVYIWLISFSSNVDRFNESRW